MTSNNEKKLLTKSDINKVFWRSFTVNASFNYERQMSQGAQYALSPILQKLYPDKKELGEALQRHAEFFNTTPITDGGKKAILRRNHISQHRHHNGTRHIY